MNKAIKSVTAPVTQPAPPLPSIPASPDDPFQPDIERQVITPEPDDPTKKPQPVTPGVPKRPRNADEELPTVL